MSKVALSGNASGSGTFTIASPNSNTDRTLTLPDNTGTLVSTGSTAGVSQAMLASGVAGNGPAFSAYSTVGQSLTSTVTTKIQYNNELFDTAGAFDSTTNYRFTPLVAGYYQINANATLGGSSAMVAIYIYKNGNAASQSVGYFQAGVLNATATTSQLIYLNGSTDFVEIYAYQGSGTTYNLTNSNSFGVSVSGFLARAA